MLFLFCTFEPIKNSAGAFENSGPRENPPFSTSLLRSQT